MTYNNLFKCKALCKILSCLKQKQLNFFFKFANSSKQLSMFMQFMSSSQTYIVFEKVA